MEVNNPLLSFKIMDLETNNTIVDIGKELIGKEDVSMLLNFSKGYFEEIMIATGWNKQQAWTTYMTELIWNTAFDIDKQSKKELELLFSCSSLATWYNFRKSEWLVGESPRVGALLIWQEYKDGKPDITSGSCIVERIEDNLVYTIEGIVSKKGGNDSLIAVRKTRNLNYSIMNGARPRGFIYPLKAIV